MRSTGSHAHERRYVAPGERLRAPERIALLEVPRVVGLSLEAISAVRVLDVGTGTGVFAQAFLEHGLDVTGIDPNPDLLKLAKGYAPKAGFLQATAEKLPFDDAEFDLVMMSHVLHEADDPAAALAEARRVARQRVVVLEWPYVDEEQGPPLAHRLRASRIESLARDAGFTRVERTDLSHMMLYRLTP